MRHGWTRENVWRSLNGNYLIIGDLRSTFFNLYLNMNFVAQYKNLLEAFDAADRGVKPGEKQ